VAASLARRLRVPLEKATVRVRGHFWTEGSALAGTLQAGCDGFEMELELASPAPPEQVARVVALARSACYVEQALTSAVPVRSTVTLNGLPLEMAGEH
jgi:uncharacterized OsmC-like protein